MDFQGHELIILEKGWVFDITDFVGYKVKTGKDGENVTNYEKAFSIEDSKDEKEELHVTRFISIPLRVTKRAKRVIEIRRGVESSGTNGENTSRDR